jgi:hypothetical protein
VCTNCTAAAAAVVAASSSAVAAAAVALLLRMMPPLIAVTWLTVAAMMNDGGDADDDAVHQNVRNRCGSNKMRDDDDVDINYCVLLQMLLTMMQIFNFKMNFQNG